MIRYAISVPLIALAALVGASALANAVAHYAHAPHVGRCFPASSWDGSERAPDSVRPCVRVSRVYEDGSFRAVVSDANGTPRYSVGVGARDR